MDFLLQYAGQTWRSMFQPHIQSNPTGHVHLRRDTTPAVCYDDCNNAYKIGLSDGDKTDRLCAENGSFMQVYNICIDCIKENSDSTKDTVNADVQNEFKQFLDKCKDSGSASTIAPNKNVIPTTSCAGCATTVLTDYTRGVITVVLGTKTGAATASLSNFFTVTRTLKVTQTAHPGSGSGSDSNDDSSNANIPIIVGSVIPSFVFLACAAFFGVWWWKRRQKQPKEQKLAHVEGGSSEKPEVEYKAQLPSDCVPRPTYELEGSAPIAPGSFSSDTAFEAEMPANEVPAQEMPTEVNNTKHQPGNGSLGG
ncbi:hypothetical protein BHE90_007450 [Fusarium euwallaceae]|uniref:Uncharacterized protein n=1 Tax=Fusarium euwallaceae TaxID=1147111 RepID=A0A430LQV3_9HYPO|nr:hypothetical protein BHE90_007450 [Fusarium euwallaceae]